MKKRTKKKEETQFSKIKIGTAIKTIRKSKGYKQIEFAEMLGVVTNYYNTIENNKKQPSIPMLEKIAHLLGIHLSFLFIMSISKEDVPVEKHQQFDFVMPSITEMVKSLISE